MVAIQAYYQPAQYCLDDRTMLEYQMMEIQRTISGSEQPTSLYMSFHYCPTCNSYSTDQGMNKNPLEAARSFYRENPSQGKPEEVVGVKIVRSSSPKI